MSRPTRLRRPPAKYVKEENSPEINKKSQKDEKKVKNDPLNALRSPILRDRTNLTIDSLKADNQLKNTDKNPPKMSKELKEKRGMKTRAQEVAEILKKSEKIEKNSEKNVATRKIIKRQVSSRSSKIPETQKLENPPKDSPDLKKPAKITRSSKNPTKPPNSIPKPEKPVQTSSKASKSSKPSVVINKPPPKPPKNPKNSPKSVKRSSKRLSTKSPEKSPKKTDKKFFRTRKNVSLTHSKISPMKRGMRKAKPLKSKKSPKSYQQTLKESFAKAKKSLRPRKIDKNYNENSKIPEVNDKAKGPVYKNLKIVEESPKDKNKVYEFSFDINDSNERFRKKRKKRTVRKAPAKRAKTIKESVPLPEVKKKEDSAKIPEANTLNVERPKIITDKIDEINKNDDIPEEFQRNNSDNSQDQLQEPIEVLVDVHEPPTSPASSIIDVPESKNPSKVKIISNTRLEGSKRISLTSTPLNSEIKEKTCPSTFRNRPSSQYRTMLNHSLIRRSFSPITKEQNEKFDASSPWRPVVVSGFSRIKNVVQSTPQGRKLLTPHGINSLTTDNKGATNKINKIVEAEESLNSENSPRKFGTVLSNVSSSPSKSPTMLKSLDNSPRKTSGGKENENKSPGKSPIKKIKGLMEDSSLHAKSGISGVQKNLGILRQSNLNDFLNIPSMPESTSIVTAHGIFDDNQATPISGRQKRNLGDFGVGNAFGFDEESTADSSIVAKSGGHAERVVVVQKKEPTRLPVKRLTVEIQDKQENEGEKASTIKKHAEATKSDVVEAEHFHDTFDAEDRETSPVEVPLFVDPEPVHFRQPPRYSYSKRKRAVKWNTSDETENSDAFDSGDDENNIKQKNKKRKLTKAQREQQKILDDWAKSVNETFDEIEHFDLVVE